MPYDKKHQKHLQVECPVCHAPPLTNCRIPTGSYKIFHEERKQEALRKLALQTLKD